MPLLNRKWELADDICAALAIPEVTKEVVFSELATPPNPQLGHLAFPCFRLAKLLKKSTDLIARDLSVKLQTPDRSAQPAGPYVNVKWGVGALTASVLGAIKKEGVAYGGDKSGNGKKILIEFCSPNIAKQLAFHHIRSTLIGNTLSNVYSFTGHAVTRINFVGDWGTQFARLLVAVEQWGDPQKLTSLPVPQAMAQLAELYVRFNKDLDENPERLEATSSALKRLEAHEAKAVELWTFIREISLKAMGETLSRMGIRFDLVEGESTYISQMDTTLAQIKEKAGARLSEGAWIVDVEGLSTPALIQKRDSTTLYLTRDIAAATDRERRFQFDQMLYVVSEQQKLHFQLLFGVLLKMGHRWASRCQHISFGTVLFGSEKMSTRQGRVFLLDDVLNDAKRFALEECTTKNPDLPDKERVAEQVGLGAVIFGELSAHRGRDIEFDWKRVLSFDGETGPYVQYAYVRCVSLLKKASVPRALQDIDLNGFAFSPEEELLVVLLGKFREILHLVVSHWEPYHLTHYLIDVAKAFSRFYYRFPVLQAGDPQSRAIRLELVKATSVVLENGLKLLSIQCPEEM